MCCKCVEAGDSYTYRVRHNKASIHKTVKEFRIDRKRDWSEKYDELKSHSGRARHKRNAGAREPLSRSVVVLQLQCCSCICIVDLVRLFVC